MRPTPGSHQARYLGCWKSSINARASLGLAMEWSIPAARQRSRSPALAWAVIAIIGRCFNQVAAFERNRRHR